jgi:hypothetical protein
MAQGESLEGQTKTATGIEIRKGVDEFKCSEIH